VGRGIVGRIPSPPRCVQTWVCRKRNGVCKGGGCSGRRQWVGAEEAYSTYYSWAIYGSVPSPRRQCALASLYLLYRSVLLLTIVGRFPGHGRGLSALRPHSSQQAAVCRTRTSPSGRMPCRGSVHPMSLNIVQPSGVELAALQSDASGVACVCRTRELRCAPEELGLWRCLGGRVLYLGRVTSQLVLLELLDAPVKCSWWPWARMTSAPSSSASAYRTGGARSACRRQRRQ
jgi:hypothetical protein